MTSTIYLYKDSKITPERNFIVEDVEEYLSTLTNTITINGFQYLRNDLKLTIKINRGEESVDTIKANNYNYLRVIQNSVSYYYFIVKKTQLATSTIALELALDSINTFLLGRDFYATNRTRVLREHKDRLKRYVHALDFTSLETASWAIGNPFPDDAGSPFNVNVELESAEGDFVSFPAIARYYYDGSHKSLYLSQINIENGLELVNALNPIKIQIFNEDFSTFYASIVSFEDVSITPHYNILRNIDYYGEGINPVLYKKELGFLDNTNGLEWNLIYRNHSEGDNTAIDCFCLPSSGDIKVVIPANKTLTYNNFEDGKYYVFAPWNNVNYNLTTDNSRELSVRTNGTNIICKVVKRTGTNLQVRAVHYSGYISGNRIAFTKRTLYDWINITSLTFEELEIKYEKADSIPDITQLGIIGYLESNGSFNSTIDSEDSLATLEDVNRAEPKLVKIITIPYFPSNYEYDPVDYTFITGETWTFESSVYHSLQLNNLNAEFLSTIESDIENPLDVFDLGGTNPDIGANRNDYFESKLFHSEFYQPKFVYDSFGFVFELDKIDEALFTPSAYFSFEFIMTSTINSKFMFKFPEYVLKFSTSDYDNILPVARNNEAPIYNSAYITYLRTAYRYDLKAFGQRESKVYFGAVSTTFENASNVVEGALSTGNADYVGFGLNIVKTIFNGINELNSNEWNMEAKIQQLKNQANSVSGSDDLDLMKNYAKNKAKLCLYEVSPRMKKLIADLFYYFGYTTNEIKIPDLYTRYYFNFLSCELEMTGISSNISESIKEDIKNKYLDGITLLHNTGNEWDFEQVKENWENSIL